MAEQAPVLQVEFAGEWATLDPERPFVIGREGDLTVDDNQYLHRQFLEIRNQDGLWWLSNVGTRLSATVSSGGGAVQSWLSPGARLPIVFEECSIVFTAGPTTYEFSVHLKTPSFLQQGGAPLQRDPVGGDVQLEMGEGMGKRRQRLAPAQAAERRHRRGDPFRRRHGIRFGRQFRQG